MAATLTSVAAVSGNPGDQITLTGTGFLAGIVVTYVGDGQTLTDAAPVVVSATVITSIVPDFGGDAAALSITVQNLSEPPTAAVAFALNQWPPVDAVYPLCGLNAVRSALGLDPTERQMDCLLRNLILAASAQMLNQVTYDIKPVTLTGELYDGNGMSSLELRRLPIVSVSSVAIDGTAVDVSELAVYPDYIAFQDADSSDWLPRLRSGCRIFSWGRQNVVLDYIAGFTNVPSDLSQGCVQQVMFLRNLLSKQGVISDANSQTSATTMYSQMPIAPYVQRVCNRYRKSAVQSV